MSKQGIKVKSFETTFHVLFTEGMRSRIPCNISNCMRLQIFDFPFRINLHFLNEPVFSISELQQVFHETTKNKSWFAFVSIDAGRN